MEKTKAEEQQSQETKSESTGSPLRRSIAGGLIGAAVGYLADPENGKKLVGSMQPGKLKDAGTGLGQTVKDKTKKAAGSVKGSVGQLFSKQESVPEKGYSNEQGETDENETSLKTDLNNHSAEEGNDSSKTEDQLLNDRLEQMLTKIIDERLGQRKETASDNDKSEPSNESASSQQQAEQDSENKKEAQPSAENEESASYVKQDSLNEKDKQEDQEEKTSKNEKQEEAKETKNNSDYESLKEENEHLQQRLGKIEGLLTKLLQEGNSSQQSSNAKKDEKDSQNKQEEKQADSKEKTEENKQEDEEKKAEEKNKSEENEQEKKQQKEKNGAADESKKNNSSEKEASVSSEKIKEAYNVLSDENADTYLLANGSKKER